MCATFAFMKHLLVVMLLILLAGCAIRDAWRAEQRTKYIGHPIEAMYDSWGVPASSAPLQNGGRYYQFVDERDGVRYMVNAATDPNGLVTSLRFSRSLQPAHHTY
jgi:hypothetical protein